MLKYWVHPTIVVFFSAATGYAQLRGEGGFQPILTNVNVTRTSVAGISVLPLNAPPINGFIPRVVFTLTDGAADESEFDFYAHPSDGLFGNQVFLAPNGPKYAVATYDTGAQAHIFTDATLNSFGVSQAGLQGSAATSIIGANGSESATITNPLGVFITGVGNVTSNSPLTVPTSTLRGEYNVAALRASSSSALPNIIGSPLAFFYETHIRNSMTRQITVGGQTYSTPQVDLLPVGAPIPASAPPMRFQTDLIVLPSDFGVTPPAFFPDIFAFPDDPTSPTVSGSLFIEANVAHTGGARVDQRFLFDTGAEVTVLSKALANKIGFDYVTSTPDFFVEVAGVGGSSQNVPGFYLQQLSLNVIGGDLNFTNVPVIVLNVRDPGTETGFVPGILGTNLFTDRDLLINVDLANGGASLEISDIITAQWNVDASSNWNNATNWMLGVPNAVDAPANFYSKVTAPRTVNVDGSFTVGSMRFDNTNSYNLSGAGAIRVETSNIAATISVASGSHTIGVPVTLASNTNIDVTLSTSTLTFTNAITSTGTGKNVTKTGAGTVATPAIGAASLSINGGTLKLTGGTSRVTALTVAAGTKLDLTTGAMIVDYDGSGTTLLTTLSALVKSGRGTSVGGIATYNGFGVISTSAATANATAHFNKYAVGVINNADVAAFTGAAKPTFGGLNVDASSILMRYTYNGDANLDGVINVADYTLINATFAGTHANVGWLSGDFNLDGSVNADDYAIIDFGFLTQGLPLGFGDPVGVPEPHSLAMLLLGASAVVRHRRRS